MKTAFANALIAGSYCEIASHRETIHRLRCIPSALASTAGELASTIAENERDAWMVLEPGFDGGRLTVRYSERYPLVVLEKGKGVERKTTPTSCEEA